MEFLRKIHKDGEFLSASGHGVRDGSRGAVHCLVHGGRDGIIHQSLATLEVHLTTAARTVIVVVTTALEVGVAIRYWSRVAVGKISRLRVDVSVGRSISS